MLFGQKLVQQPIRLYFGGHKISGGDWFTVEFGMVAGLENLLLVGGKHMFSAKPWPSSPRQTHLPKIFMLS